MDEILIWEFLYLTPLTPQCYSFFIFPSFQPYDVVFSIGGSNFWAHQAILSTRSKYFERMFDGE